MFYDDDEDDDDYYYNYDNEVQTLAPTKKVYGRKEFLKRLSPPGGVGDNFQASVQSSARLSKKQEMRFGSPLAPRKP